MITNELNAITVCNQTAYNTLGDTMVESDMMGFVSVVCQSDVTSAVDAMFDMDKAYNDMQDKVGNVQLILRFESFDWLDLFCVC